jgi:hypothetical protein
MLSNIYGIKNGKKENMLNENLREYKKKLIQTYKNKHVNKLHKFITFKKVVKFPSILKSSHFQHIMINYKVWSQI